MSDGRASRRSTDIRLSRCATIPARAASATSPGSALRKSRCRSSSANASRTASRRAGAAFSSSCASSGRPVDDVQHVLHVVAGEDISVAAAGECGELGRDECGGRDEPDFDAVAERDALGRIDGLRVPGIGEAQYAGIDRHEVERHAGIAVEPAADDAAVDVAPKAARCEILLDLLKLRQTVDVDDRIDILGRSHPFRCRVGHQQFRHRAADEHHALAQAPQRRRDRAQIRQVALVT